MTRESSIYKRGDPIPMSKKILLADDSLTIQKVVELTFMEGDFEVMAVSNGDDALGRLEEGEPDVVIADVHMPGADGFTLSKTTKEKYPGTPVLLLVGTFEPFDEGAAQECGADAHLKKPFDSQELLRLVEDLLSAKRDEGADDVSDSFASESFELADAESAEPDDLDISFGEDAPLGEDQAVVVQPPDDLETGDADASLGGEAAVEDSTMSTPMTLSDEDVESLARRVVELIGDQTVREISWDVIPDLAEIVIKDRIRELEGQVD